MRADYTTILLDNVYAGLGVPATLDVGTGGVPLVVIDKTRQVSTIAAGRSGFGLVDVETQTPAAVVRRAELNARGVVLTSLDGALLTFEGATWIIKSYNDFGGEVSFALMEPDASGSA